MNINSKSKTTKLKFDKRILTHPDFHTKMHKGERYYVSKNWQEASFYRSTPYVMAISTAYILHCAEKPWQVWFDQLGLPAVFTGNLYDSL